MHDPDFDGELPKKPMPAMLIKPTKPRWVRPGLAELLRWPIPGMAQAVFAESFRQGILEGLPIDGAIWLAAEVNPSPRFRSALKRMAMNIRSGYSLEAALEKTRAKVQVGLKAALKVGEEHGGLADELASFAERTRGFTARRYFLAIGRKTEAIDFAAALGRLLRNERLTVHAVRAAGEVSANGRPAFLGVSKAVAEEMENGRSLVDALGQHPGWFDLLYRGLIEATNSREELRACLDRLGVRP